MRPFAIILYAAALIAASAAVLFQYVSNPRAAFHSTMSALVLVGLAVLLTGCSVVVRPILALEIGALVHKHHHHADAPVCAPKDPHCIDDSGMGNPDYRP